MVDSVLASRAQNASGVGGTERARGRGPVDAVRGVERTGQRAFGSSFAEATASLQPVSNDQTSVGSGLLSTGVQIMLAETRSQEAAAPFVAPSKLGQALNVYQETQTQVRDTIRANGGQPTVGAAALSDAPAQASLPAAANAGGLSAASANGAVSTGAPIDSSIDEELV